MLRWEVSRQAALAPRNLKSPRAAADPAHLSQANPRAMRGGHAVEVLVQKRAYNPTAWGRCRASSSKNIDPAPARNIVWGSRRSTLLVGKEKSRLIQDRPAARNIVAQLRPGAPEQGHGAGDVRRRHRRAAKICVIGVGAVVA